MKNLEKIFKNYGILLSREQKTQFDAYFSMLIETNKQLNLTTITEEDEVVVKHFLDSVLPKIFSHKILQLLILEVVRGFQQFL